MYHSIVYEVKDFVAKITLNRPKSLNAFTSEMNAEVTKAMKQAKNDSNVRCIVITGEGVGFCSGQDLLEVEEGANYGQIIRERYSPMVLEIVTCEKPTIAAVNGVAAGAGFSLALACDFRLMKESAYFVNAFIHVGLVPDTGNLYFLERLIGYGRTLELALLGEKINASRALEWSLVNRVLSVEAFTEEVDFFAKKLSNLPTKTVGFIKSQAQYASSNSFIDYLEREAQLQTMAGRTDDHKEGVLAFKEKRIPKFVGK